MDVEHECRRSAVTLIEPPDARSDVNTMSWGAAVLDGWVGRSAAL